MKRFKRMVGFLTAAALSFTAVSVIPSKKTIEAEAASEKYAVQEFRLGIGDTNRNVSISGSDSGSYLNSQKEQGTRDEKWSLNYISSGTYEIVNSATGYIVTNDGGIAAIAPDIDGADQRWNIVGVDKDFEGQYLYYKIVSAADGSTALTFNANSNSLSAETYTGDKYQKFKLNLDGLEGFAANAKVSQGEKAGTIGGLLGETVFVSNDKELINALGSTEPKTIVLTQTIDTHTYGQIRVRDDKTITGYYGVTLKDCQLRTNNQAGNDTSNKPSDNIVIRNLTLLAKDSTNCILVNIYSSRNVWIDHCTFNSELTRNRDEVGKFVWVNTPYDGVDLQRSPDYITISYNIFSNRYWTFAYGTQNGETTRCRTTLMYNNWENDVRRCPQIGNGTGHIYSSYFNGFNTGGESGTAQIIGGDGSEIVSENCRFENISQVNTRCISAGGGPEPYRDSGSYLNNSPITFNPKVTSTWQPSKNYGYTLINGYDNGYTDTRTFCTTYAGAFKSYDSIKYITDSDMSKFVAKKYPCPFTKDIEVGDDPVSGGGVVLDENAVYSFRNVNSGLYLEVENGTAASGTNVMQDRSDNRNVDLWTVRDAGDGYYYLCTKADNNGALCLDLPYGSADNGTSLGIWTNDESDARKFRFVDNGDGSYTITTKSSVGKSCLGVLADSTDIGADVIQWTRNNNDSQKWEVLMNSELISDFKCLDTAHSASWTLAEDLQVGSLLYGDRETTYADIPQELVGAEYIRPACDAKTVNADLAAFTAAKNADIYAALDSRVSSIPTWLSGWEKTNLTATSNTDVVFTIYKKSVIAGESVILGTNGQSNGCVNYTVFIAENQTEVTGDINGDGVFNVSDVVILQKWLLAVPNTELANWKAGDLCEDGRLDVFDLCMMKRLLLSK